MVDFRYHLVSIIAIFLALALGIVVGTTALNGALVDGLRGSINTLTGEKRGLESSVSDLKDEVASDEKLIDNVDDTVVSGVLTGQRIVLLSTPGAPDSTRDDLVPLLTAAGAAVTGEVALRPDLLDPAKTTALGERVAALAPSGVTLSGLTPIDRAGQVLAAALVRQPGVGAVPRSVADTVLDGMGKADLIDVRSPIMESATLAVVLVGGPVTTGDPVANDARLQAVLAIVAPLDATGQGTVVGGPLTATEPTGLLKGLRDDGDLAGVVSSVDGVNRSPGRLGTVLALREQLSGKAGQYGTGPGNDGPSPPTPPR